MTGIVAVQRPTSVPSHTRSCMMSRQNEMVPALHQQPGTVDNTCERGAVMADRTCSFLGCSRPARARGWCTLHYQRWQRHGSPEVVLPTGPRPNRRAVNYHGYIRLEVTRHHRHVHANPEESYENGAMLHRHGIIHDPLGWAS